MKLYYTTSAGEDQVQNKKIVSLGGYKSSTVVPNNRISNLFGEITPRTLEINQPQYIALYLRNETGGDITGVKVYFTYPENCYSKLEIGAVSPGVDSLGVDYIERVQDFHTQPYSADFYEADGVENQVELGDLTSNSSFGIYLKRSILKDVITSDLANRYTKDEITGIYSVAELGREDEIKVIFAWD